MIEGLGIHMANHSSGWFALIDVINLPINGDNDFECLFSNNRYAIKSFKQLVTLSSKFVPILGYNARIAAKKVFEEKDDR